MNQSLILGMIISHLYWCLTKCTLTHQCPHQVALLPRLRKSSAWLDLMPPLHTFANRAPQSRVGMTPSSANHVCPHHEGGRGSVREATVRAEAEVAVIETKPLPLTLHITTTAPWTGPFLPPQRVDHARPNLGEQRCSGSRRSRMWGRGGQIGTAMTHGS
jgi:hypothetical protein